MLIFKHILINYANLEWILSLFICSTLIHLRLGPLLDYIWFFKYLVQYVVLVFYLLIFVVTFKKWHASCRPFFSNPDAMKLYVSCFDLNQSLLHFLQDVCSSSQGELPVTTKHRNGLRVYFSSACCTDALRLLLLFLRRRTIDCSCATSVLLSLRCALEWKEVSEEGKLFQLNSSDIVMSN